MPTGALVTVRLQTAQGLWADAHAVSGIDMLYIPTHTDSLAHDFMANAAGYESSAPKCIMTAWQLILTHDMAYCPSLNEAHEGLIRKHHSAKSEYQYRLPATS